MRLRFRDLLDLSILILVLLSVTTSSVAQSAAAKPATSAPQTTTAPSAVPQSTALAADLLKEALVFESNQVKVKYEDDGSGTFERTAVVHVLAQAGVQALAVLKFPYTSADQTVEFDYVRVRKPDGTVIVTPEYNVHDMPAEITRDAPMYSDIHEKHVTVKALSIGDTLEYRLRYRTTKPQVPGQFWYEYSFLKDVIAKDEQLEIDVPRDKYVKVVSPDYTPQIKDDGARRIYTWKTQNLERTESDPRALQIPKREAPQPSVELTTFRSWEDVGRWYGELQRSQVVVTPQIQAKAAELTKGLASDQDRIRALYDYVSIHFHYVSLSFGIGRYQPHAAEDVLENEYGDCKDKHTLLAALLKAAGYDAWPALINATRKVNPDVPSPGQFDHVFTVVPQGSTLLWLDTTPEVSPFGLLMSSLRGKQALVIPTGKPAQLMTAPSTIPFAGSVTFSADGQISADGTLTAHIQQTLRGDNEVGYRYAFRSTPNAQWKELTQNLSYRQGFAGEVSNVTATPPDQTAKPFEYSYDYTRKSYGDWDNHRIPTFTPIFGIEGYAAIDKKPEEPILLGATGDVVYTARLKLPAGFTATTPAKLDLSEDFADYHSSYEFKDGVLTETRRMTVKRSEVPLSSWDSFKKFAKAVGDDRENWTQLNAAGENVQAPRATNPEADRLFQEGAEAMQRRDITRAQESFNRVLQLDPKYPGAHGNLGIVYLSSGSIEAGVRELRKEEELNPDLALPYETLARVYIYQKNEAAAIEQLQKLLAIDPKNRDAALNLGRMLSQQHKYSDAVAELQKAYDLAPDSGAVKYQLGFAYIHNGEKDKGLNLLEKALAADQDTDHGSEALNNVAYSLIDMDVGLDIARDYAAKALQQQEAESLKAGEGREGLFATASLEATWDTIGWVYFRRGLYDQALPYVRASWLLGQDAEVGDHLGQVYAKLGRKNDGARAYRLAYAALGQEGRVAANPTTAQGNVALSKQISDHYKDLMGKDAQVGSFSVSRSPDGTYNPMPTEELSRMRSFEIPGTAHQPPATGTVSIVFSPGKVEAVTLIDDKGLLPAITDDIKKTKFDVEFPNTNPARLVRRGVVSCRTGHACEVVLIPVDDRNMLSAE